MAKTTGCALSGFALVKKVPGTLHFLAKSPGHSFDHQAMNMSHVVNYLYFGNRPSPKRRKVWLRLLCLGSCPALTCDMLLCLLCCVGVMEGNLNHSITGCVSAWTMWLQYSSCVLNMSEAQTWSSPCRAPNALQCWNAPALSMTCQAAVQQLQRLHPGGLEDDWSDKMAARDFFSGNQQATFEHYIQVRMLTHGWLVLSVWLP